MTISPAITPAVAAQWRLALAEAEIGETDAHLLSVAGQAPPNEPKAAYYPAGRSLVDEPGDIIRGPALEEANSVAVINKQRIAIYADFDETDPLDLAIVGGKLRHELRHAEQRLSACGPELFNLVELADEIARVKVGGLPGGASIYNLMPVEVDANAAAAGFLRAHHGTVVAEILRGNDAALARSNTPPGDIADLPAKTVAFMFVFREIAENPAQFANITFERRLEHISSAAAARWRALAA